MGVNSSASYDIQNTNYLSPPTLDSDKTIDQKMFSIVTSIIATLRTTCASVMAIIRSACYGPE